MDEAAAVFTIVRSMVDGPREEQALNVRRLVLCIRGGVLFVWRLQQAWWQWWPSGTRARHTQVDDAAAGTKS